jgi:hypothetical protein
VGALFIGASLIPIFMRRVFERHAEDRLGRIIAETDKEDPSWRLEDLEAARALIRDDQNGALCVLAAKKLLPEKWPDDSLDQALKDHSWADPPGADLRRILRDQVKEHADALKVAHRLEGLPQGRYDSPRDSHPRLPTSHAPDEFHRVAELLACEASSLGQDGDLRSAWSACTAMFNTGTAIGDEPLIGAQSARLAIRQKAIECIEYTLGCGQLAESDLMRMQTLLEKEELCPLTTMALKSERAYLHRLWTLVETGEVDLHFARMLCSLDTSNDTSGPKASEVMDEVKLAHRSSLEALNQWIRLSELPIEKRNEEAEELERSLRNGNGLDMAHRLVLTSRTVYYRAEGGRALLQSAVVSLAVERYRLRHGRWPESLASLVPDFLIHVPLDPFDNKPFRFRRLQDQVIVYCVGGDREDCGGQIRKGVGGATGTNLGFRLWNPDQRPRPPAPSKKPDD